MCSILPPNRISLSPYPDNPMKKCLFGERHICRAFRSVPLALASPFRVFSVFRGYLPQQYQSYCCPICPVSLVSVALAADN